MIYICGKFIRKVFLKNDLYERFVMKSCSVCPTLAVFAVEYASHSSVFTKFAIDIWLLFQVLLRTNSSTEIMLNGTTINSEQPIGHNFQPYTDNGG